MQSKTLRIKLMRSAFLLAFLIKGLSAQACLSLSTAATAPGGAANLDLSLDFSSDTPPAAVQWTFQYPASAISSITVDDGPAVTAAGKAVICANGAAGYTCMVVGRNVNTISKGIIAKITVVLAPDARSAAIQLANTLAASVEGYFIPISGRGGIVTSANASEDGRLRPPLKRIGGLRCSITQ
jgi:hypothetical protein